MQLLSLQLGVHRGNCKDPWGKKKRTPKTTFSQPWAYTAHRSCYYRQQFQHNRKGGLGAGQDHQGINIHKGKQSYLEPKHW